jgi:hypothetical protein
MEEGSMDEAQLRQEWQQSFETIERTISNEKFEIGGVNLRINVRKLLEAVWHSAKFYLEATVVSHGAVEPATVLGMAESTFSVISCGLAAFRETMTPAAYFASVMLSRGGGCPSVQFEAELGNFIDGISSALPFYLGLSRHRADLARKALGERDGANRILSELRNSGRIHEADGVIQIKERHFMWGFRSEAP